jgi:molybdopterin-guanine dinucleotide biosynthesis protein A
LQCKDLSLSRAIIVLAGGLSSRFGQDKCMKELCGKPLIVHVLDRVASLGNELIVVVGSETQRNKLPHVVSARIKVVVDKYSDHSPLVGALTGFESAQSDLALLLPCDAALISADIASLLLDLCVDRSAVIPRWPDGKIEPLQAAYNVKHAATATEASLKEGKLDMLGMISHLRGIRYVSTLVLQQYDPALDTFLNINTIQDWKKAERVLQRTKQHVRLR